MSCSATEGFFSLPYWKSGIVHWCLPLTEWQFGLDLEGGGGFYFVPHLIPGRPFSPRVMSQLTLMGKAVELSAKTGSQPWENRNWHASWAQ